MANSDEDYALDEFIDELRAEGRREAESDFEDRAREFGLKAIRDLDPDFVWEAAATPGFLAAMMEIYSTCIPSSGLDAPR